jgi:hypothetical protein
MSRYFDVAKYDVNDDPCKDGDWQCVASRVPEDQLGAPLADLFGRGYDAPSIDVTDADTGERLPEDEWPR